MRRSRKHSLLSRLKAATRNWYAAQFHDPAEIRLLEILGGTTFTIGRVTRDGRPLTFVLSHGKLLKSEGFRRVALDNKSVLYMNDVNQILAIQGYDYERDVLRYQEQEDALKERGYRVRYIPQRWLENNPMRALQSVQQFIYY